MKSDHVKGIAAGLSSVVPLFFTAGAHAQVGSPQCLAAQQAVTSIQKQIAAFELTRNDPRYAGSAITLYNSQLKALNTELQVDDAAVTVDCSPAGANQVGDIRPKYFVLTVVYAPPGTNGGKGSSYVEYSQGSSLGSTFTTIKTYKQDYDVTASASFGSDSGAGASVSLGVDWNETDTTKTQLTVKQTAKNDTKVSSAAADGINHDEDHIYLLLNPIVHVTISGKKLNYSNGVDGAVADIIYVYPPWLRNPSSMPADVAQHLAARGMTADDYAQILTADPFATGSTAIDPRRFVQTNTTLPYEAPLMPTDGATLSSYTVTSETDNTQTATNQTSTSLDLKITVSEGFPGIAKISLTDDNKSTWTHSSSNANANGTSSSATAAVGDPSFGYKGPIDIGVYYDTIFNSFLFAPFSTQPLATGTILTPAGTPARGELVTLLVNGRTYRTYTGSRGQYRLYGHSSLPAATSAVLTAGSVRKTINVGGAMQKVDVKFPHVP
jgi:hypothetical protein